MIWKAYVETLHKNLNHWPLLTERCDDDGYDDDDDDDGDDDDDDDDDCGGDDDDDDDNNDDHDRQTLVGRPTCYRPTTRLCVLTEATGAKWENTCRTIHGSCFLPFERSFPLLKKQ